MVKLNSIGVQQAVQKCVVEENRRSIWEIGKLAARDTAMNFRLFQLGEKVPKVVSEVFANMKYPEFLPELNKEMPGIFSSAGKAMCVSRAYTLLYSVVQSEDDKGLDKTLESRTHEVVDTIESCSHVALLVLKYNPTVRLVGEVAGFVANVIELKLNYDEYCSAGDAKFEAAVQERVAQRAPRVHADHEAAVDHEDEAQVEDQGINTFANKVEAFGAKQTETMYKIAKLSCSILSALAGYFLAASSMSFYLGFAAVFLAIKAWHVKNSNGMRVGDMAHVNHGLTAYKSVAAMQRAAQAAV